MRLSQVLRDVDPNIFEQIVTECGEFISAAGQHPLLKNLSTLYDDIHRVKVRKRKTDTDFTKTFNEAFNEEFYELRQRAVFANGVTSLKEGEIDEEPFYIFPINGFKFLYSTEVENSSQQYQSVFEAILEHLNENAAGETIRDLLKFSYHSTNLREGIDSGAEIIIYNIPYYYAVKQSAVPDYSELLSTIAGE